MTNLMAKLILHIGTEKTGSTALQNFLAQNKEVLLEQNYYIPTFLGSIDHRWLPVIMYPLERRDDLTDSCIGHEEKDREKIVTNKRTEFEKRARQDNDQTWIISSEHLQARLKNKQEIEKLRTFLMDYFEEINVICYLRKPIEAVTSLWSTAARHGHCWEKLPLPGSHIDRVCNHKQTDQLWSSSFGSAFSVRLYTKSELYNENIIDDFNNYAGIDSSKLLSASKTHNPSMSEVAIKTMSLVNKKLNPILRTESDRIDRNTLMREIEECFSSLPGFVPSHDERMQYHEYYKESDEYILAKYFPDKKDLWLTPKKPEQREKRLEKTNDADIHESFANLLVNMWLQERNKEADLKLKTEALENEMRIIKTSRTYHFFKLLAKIRNKLFYFVKNKNRK